MANKRIISSGIFEDEFFGQLGMMQRLLWIGLFTRCADDQGRTIDNPIVIRSQVFPFDDIPASEIDKALALFAVEGKLIRYKDERGRGYLQLVKWWENQAPQWAMPSKYPAPEGWKDRVRSYIKGVYHCENWPERVTKADKPAPVVEPDKTPPHLDTPPGQSTLSPQVAGHEINPVLNPVLNPNPEINPLIKEEEEDLAPPTPHRALSMAFETTWGIQFYRPEAWSRAIDEMLGAGVEAQDLKAAKQFNDERLDPYSVTGPWSVVKMAATEAGKRRVQPAGGAGNRKLGGNSSRRQAGTVIQ